MKKNIYSAFGLNQREIFDQTLNAWKMMWEQLLMIAIYARQQYMQSNQSNADNFHQRMKMIHLLNHEYSYRARSNLSFDKDIPDIFDKVLALIEDECGSTKIIEFLLDEEVSQFQTSKKRILSQMEQAKIAFSPNRPDYKRSYSYYSLYEILHDPIFYISKIMSIPVPDKQVIHATVVNTTYDYLTQNRRFLLSRNENPIEKLSKSTEDKEQIILENLSFLEGKEDIKKLIKGQIADFIGKDVSKVFNLLSDPFYNEENPQNKLFTSVFTIRPEADAFNISLDRKALINLMNLNQLDELASVMKSEIKKAVLNKNQRTRNFGIETKVDQASALEKISEWYIKTQTGLFNRVDQVPKLIASILEFDIRYFKGMFDPEFGFDRSLLTKNHKNSYSPLQAKEIYLFVSAYIRNYLYYDDQRPERNSPNGLLIDHLVKRDFSETSFHRNRMMEVWGTFEDEKQHRKMLDRFKRMPAYLDPQHKDYTEISYLIDKQKELGNDENAPPYPLNSFFPLPLWASRFSKKNIVEEVPDKLS
ncbi:hypothetical protein [Acinetobacter towneri]|uniref:hypothetical protein n=1 Tax=Acinetobacter towneri TaxID=202956 RepID=UPI002B25C6E8|nr:hypothetical protein [Acinetobacter towneri]WPC33496.1 hypothetical protein O4J62_14085 [Acinetobacter towneri]